ncbi:bifunctional RNase H/acid phosphatase [Nocardioides sp. ChNu-153]|uniref:bifunctional RNase H/acid phosphatase n=1 Tax=unclassified Nocardioides TaxID=2615069 RepID=UPI002404BC95|nr:MULTISPECIES: bifunctional RNase H/acid phosphatase [unclassified Nocardioides]MDF9715818.1 bifunctional RNase H/acid phosphatase [Nocardioides sp. ChNu-99]MDN7120802.1 bifunctional RNase H/acid phosphatase [Nocardioides sp. ChNu-153]
MSDAPTYREVIVEADGGSRGNPGPAAYGAVLRDARTGEVIAHDGATLGRATNNVAEYSGLVAGLRLARAFAPGASVEVRMDSKLVVEQMAGNWRIKHPDMQALAREASGLAPPGTRWTWVPRAENAYADRLANEALDGTRSGVEHLAAPAAGDALQQEVDAGAQEARDDAPVATAPAPARGWSPGGATTTLVLVRHGVTAHTQRKSFSGGLASANPPLTDEGRAQVRATADWLAPLAERVTAVVTSPVRRTRESAEIVAERLGTGAPREEPGFAEMEFGAWDGSTFAEVAERDRAGLDAWLGSLDARPGGTGESFRTVERRVLDGLRRLLAEHAGGTVVVVSHVTPIKVLVAHALGAPLEAVFRMELAPASVTVVGHFAGDDDAEPMASLRLFNGVPGTGPFGA